ncbi:MAG: tRNA lysidine(34) synthetase TilS [Omnitrophica WOR_2 bacterium GWA2_47_8]|nr:MAG: tRNA lysidine(34) synthetase TilS [Omnitrophica WOR_2 bacterium GWA2_47_8]
MDLIGQVKSFITKGALIKRRDHVLLGVSGGPDSTALLSILENLRNDLGFRLTVCHVNHGLRTTALRDEIFVKKICRDLGIKCLFVKLKPLKGSSEETARDKRLAAFFKIAHQQKANTIALAHTQDDLAETVLMRIIRGSGLRGLPSILPKRMMQGFSLIRPLLSVKRRNVLAYLNEKRIPYKIDPTNRQTKFLRNRIRLELLPLLERKYNSNIKESLANLSLIAALDYEYLNSQTHKIFHSLKARTKDKIIIPLKRINKLPRSLQRMIFYQAIEALKGDTRAITHAHILEIEGLIENKTAQARGHLPQGILFQKEKGRLSVTLEK